MPEKHFARDPHLPLDLEGSELWRIHGLTSADKVYPSLVGEG